MFTDKVKEFGKIEAKDTFDNAYANVLLVMLNYMLSAYDKCKDSYVKEMLEKDFCKYFDMLKNYLDK